MSRPREVVSGALVYRVSVLLFRVHAVLLSSSLSSRIGTNTGQDLANHAIVQ